ncbi:MAG: hypothetical protein IPI90_10600 [Saprospiraceae bacterium]|nr:hypothetical protein [Candidatus Vicinibacter affinis]
MGQILKGYVDFQNPVPKSDQTAYKKTHPGVQNEFNYPETKRNMEMVGNNDRWDAFPAALTHQTPTGQYFVLCRFCRWPFSPKE